jgi:hypothetical protein
VPWTADPTVRGLKGTFDYGAPTTPPVQPYAQPLYTPSTPYQAPSPYETNPYAAPSYQAPSPFVSPTAATMEQDPGYQFRLTEGQKALERSGAARGVTNTGGTLKDILDYGQRAASQEYGNIYNRALQNYSLNEQNRARAFDVNAALGFQAYGANELGRASAYGTNEAARRSTYDVNELTAQNAYATNAAANQARYLMNVNQAQQDYTNQFNSWVQAYNQWRQTSADRFNERFLSGQA